MELIDVPHFGWKPENSVLGLSAFVDFEITGFAFFRTEFRVDRVLPIWYRTKYTLLPHSNNLHIYSQPGGSYFFKVLICAVILLVHAIPTRTQHAGASSRMQPRATLFAEFC